MPTINSLGTGKPLDFFRISDRMPGAILQPQPPPCEKEVSLMPASAGGVAVREAFIDASMAIFGTRSVKGSAHYFFFCVLLFVCVWVCFGGCVLCFVVVVVFCFLVL